MPLVDLQLIRPLTYGLLVPPAQLTQLIKDINRCTRLKETPIPLSYTRLCSWVILLWSIFLVLVVPALGWGLPYSAVTVFSLVFLLFGIEDVGVQIEEPFHYLPIEEMVVEHAEELRQEYTTNFSIVEAHAVRRPELQAMAAGVALKMELLTQLWEQAVVRDGIINMRNGSAALGGGLESIGVGRVDDDPKETGDSSIRPEDYTNNNRQ
eukprot:scaffold5221_cov397-Prasinococcus_capsulatus_cf.AAC.2